MTVYIENVIIDNFMLTYLISEVSYKVGGVCAKKSRSIFAAAVGTAVALAYPFIKNDFALFAVKAALFALMCIILYSGKKKKTLPLVFLAVTAAFGGAVFFAGFIFCGNAERALRGLYDFSPGIIIASGFIVYKTIWKIKLALNRRRSVENFICDVKITIGGKSSNAKGLIDSGNCLFDKKSTLPVMLLSASSADVFIGEKGDYESGENFFGYTVLTDINGQKRKLPLLKPDSIEIICGGSFQSISDGALIGIIDSGNIKNGGYSAIVHPSMIKGG